MATQLNLEEQEKLDAVKHFWERFGNLITWALIVVLAAFAAWNGWKWWQRDQAVNAAAIFDELDRAAKAGEADRLPRIFDDLKDRYPRTAFAQQGGLIAAATLVEKGKGDESRAVLGWVAANAVEDEYRSIAKLRLAGELLDQKQYEEALKQVDAVPAGPFAALAADRRGDVLAAQGQAAAAVEAYRKAWQAFDPGVEYRRLVEAKLIALGGSPTGAANPSAAAAEAPAAASATSAAPAPAASAAAAAASR